MISCTYEFTANEEASTLLSSWGLTLKRSCVRSEARNLGGPDLQFNPRYTLKNAKADFTRDATTQKCYAPVSRLRCDIELLFPDFDDVINVDCMYGI